MDEDVKGSKTYTMDELLEKCSLRGGPYPPNSLDLIKKGSQTTGGTDWIENPTRFKLKETKYFLDKVRQAYIEYVKETTDENRDKLLFNLSAFISAGRSITGNYMQNQYGDDWYKEQEFEFDQELMLLNIMRVEFVHLKPYAIATERCLSYQATARIVYSEGDPRRLTAPPIPEILPFEPITSEPVTYEVVLRPDDKMKGKIPGIADEYKVLDFCNQQYEKYEKLVNECERRFAIQAASKIRHFESLIEEMRAKYDMNFEEFQERIRSRKGVESFDEWDDFVIWESYESAREYWAGVQANLKGVGK